MARCACVRDSLTGGGGGGPGHVLACEVITFNGFTLPGSHDPGHEELIKLVHHPIMRGRGREGRRGAKGESPHEGVAATDMTL